MFFVFTFFLLASLIFGGLQIGQLLSDLLTSVVLVVEALHVAAPFRTGHFRLKVRSLFRTILRQSLLVNILWSMLVVRRCDRINDRDPHLQCLAVQYGRTLVCQ